MEPGRPTELTEELTLEIRKHVLDGKSYVEIQELLGITDSAWDRWVWLDYKDFRQKLNSWKKERMIKKAERNLDSILDLEVEEPVITMIGKLKDENGDDVTKVNPNLLRVKADTSKFVVERLNKDEYSPRQENTGKDGKDLPTPILANLDVPTDNGNQKDSPAQEADTGNTGGNLSEQDNLDTADTDRPSTEGSDANPDQHSIGILSSLEARGDEGLPEHNGSPELLQSEPLE